MRVTGYPTNCESFALSSALLCGVPEALVAGASGQSSKRLWITPQDVPAGTVLIRGTVPSWASARQVEVITRIDEGLGEENFSSLGR